MKIEQNAEFDPPSTPTTDGKLQTPLSSPTNSSPGSKNYSAKRRKFAKYFWNGKMEDTIGALLARDLVFAYTATIPIIYFVDRRNGQEYAFIKGSENVCKRAFKNSRDNLKFKQEKNTKCILVSFECCRSQSSLVEKYERAYKERFIRWREENVNPPKCYKWPPKSYKIGKFSPDIHPLRIMQNLDKLQLRNKSGKNNKMQIRDLTILCHIVPPTERTIVILRAKVMVHSFHVARNKTHQKYKKYQATLQEEMLGTLGEATGSPHVDDYPAGTAILQQLEKKCSLPQEVIGQPWLEITNAVQTYYFAAIHQSNATLLKNIWHPTAHVYQLDDQQKLMIWDMKQFSSIVQNRTADTSPVIVRYDKILSVDITDNNTAMVKVQIAVGQTVFTDFLSMLRISGQWFIVSKTCTSRGETKLDQPMPLGHLSAHGKIASSLFSYFNGSHSNDLKILKQVYHPCASLKGVQKGKFSNWDSEIFFNHVESGTPDTSLATCKFDKIISIDMAGPNVACAKVQIGLPPFLCTDHLSLLRIEGSKWKIVSKTYSSQRFL